MERARNPLGTLADALGQLYGYSDAADFQDALSGSVASTMAGEGYTPPRPPEGLPGGFGGIGMVQRNAEGLLTGLLNETPIPSNPDIVKGYRALRLIPSRPGELFPAMIQEGGKKSAPSITPGAIERSGFFPATARKTAGGSGLVPRQGWHAGPLPYARQFDQYGPGGRSAGKTREAGDMVWAEVDLLRNHDYQPMMDRYPWLMNPGKQPEFAGELPPSFEVPLYLNPAGGTYQYYPNNAARRAGDPWLVGDLARHARLLPDEEAADIVNAARPDLIDTILPRKEYKRGGRIVRPDAQGWTEGLLRAEFPSWFD